MNTFQSRTCLSSVTGCTPGLRRMALLLVSLFALSACAPVVLPRVPVPIQLPQNNYPVQPRPVNVPVAQRPQPVVPRAPRQAQQRTVPKARALISAPVKVARARAPARVVPPSGRAQQRRVQQPPRVAPVRRQTQQVTVPPTLNPVQQARVGHTANTSGQRNYSRPSASVRTPSATAQSRQPIWEDIAPQAAPTQKRIVAVRRPAASVRKSAVSTTTTTNTRRETTAVAQPATPQAAQTKPAKTAQTQTAQAAQTTRAEVEVLDLSGSLAKNAPAQTRNKQSAAVSRPRSYSSSPAVAVLTKQANNQLTVGKAGSAAATLERALRIEPDNPALWLRLAEVNAQQGKKSQAVSMARKALNLAPDDAGLQARAKRLLN